MDRYVLSGVRWVLFAALLTSVAGAASITPDLSTIVLGPSEAPGVWFPDRYRPAGFNSIATYQGVSNVVEIQISSADSAANRPFTYDSTFYNTQGRKYDVSGGPGSYLVYQVWIPTEWEDLANGFRSTSFWATMSDDANTTPTAYITMFFTNSDGSGNFSVWDSSVGLLMNIDSPVNFGQWNTVGVLFTETGFDYILNCAIVYTVTDINGTTRFKDAMLQAYNRGENYSSYWANGSLDQCCDDSSLPEPASISLACAGLAALLFYRHRHPCPLLTREAARLNRRSGSLAAPLPK